MIRPKVAKPTAAEERRAYEIATARDEGKCVRCHRGGTVHRDHRLNRSQGGLTTPANLQILCGPANGYMGAPRLGQGCHAWVTEHPREAVEDGWAVPGYADPHLWPARRWIPTDHGTLRIVWVLYSDLGTFEVITDAVADELRAGAA